MYHKVNRESMGCLDDIVLIQASEVENNSAVQDLKVGPNEFLSYRLNLSFYSRQDVKSKD